MQFTVCNLILLLVFLINGELFMGFCVIVSIFRTIEKVNVYLLLGHRCLCAMDVYNE